MEIFFACFLSRMPKFVWHLRYFKRFHRLLHLNHPRDMFEQMVRFTIENANNPLWIRLADKYAVRDYVIKEIGSQYVNKLYGYWSNAAEIDFASLPEFLKDSAIVLLASHMYFLSNSLLRKKCFTIRVI